MHIYTTMEEFIRTLTRQGNSDSLYTVKNPIKTHLRKILLVWQKTYKISWSLKLNNQEQREEV